MFQSLLHGLRVGCSIGMLAGYRRVSMDLVKIEATRGYVHGVQMARLSFLGLIRMALALGVLLFGALLMHAALFVLLPWSLKVKAILVCGLGLSYVLIGVLWLYALVDERKWMQVSGAAGMVDDVKRRSATR